MFVQDISVLRQAANRSLIQDLTARDLETRKIVNFVDRIEEALAKAVRVVKRMTKAAKREQERIHELYFKKRGGKVEEWRSTHANKSGDLKWHPYKRDPRSRWTGSSPVGFPLDGNAVAVMSP